jgi:hypothetical protein
VHVSPPMRLLPLAAPLFLLAGCAPPSAGVIASARAANEFACPAPAILVQPLAPDTVRVTACGQVATYTCPVTRDLDAATPFSQWTRYCIREVTPEQPSQAVTRVSRPPQ